jgi:hypothetical protein
MKGIQVHISRMGSGGSPDKLTFGKKSIQVSKELASIAEVLNANGFYDFLNITLTLHYIPMQLKIILPNHKA